MATEDDTTHRKFTISPAAIENLADRCFARAFAPVANQSIRHDLVLVSALLRRFAIEHGQDVEVDVWRLDEDLPEFSRASHMGG